MSTTTMEPLAVESSALEMDLAHEETTTEINSVPELTDFEKRRLQRKANPEQRQLIFKGDELIYIAMLVQQELKSYSNSWEYETEARKKHAAKLQRMAEKLKARGVSHLDEFEEEDEEEEEA